LLSLRKGTTLTKEMFLDHLYGGMDEFKIIDVFICKLRKKLANASAGRNYIETVWGRGHVLLKAATPRTIIRARFARHVSVNNSGGGKLTCTIPEIVRACPKP
jgi:DNA-binding winged helix-turn-helix (wHTH) protein